jgi:hypothetical protein
MFSTLSVPRCYKQGQLPVSSEKILYNDLTITVKIQIISGRKSHEAWRQNELIGGKLPVAK